MTASTRPGPRRCLECKRFLKATAPGDLCPTCERRVASQPTLEAFIGSPPPATPAPPAPPVPAAPPPPARRNPLAGVPNVDVGVVIPRPSELHRSVQPRGLTSLRGRVVPVTAPDSTADQARRGHPRGGLPVIPLSVQILIGVVIGAVIAVAVPLLLSP